MSEIYEMLSDKDLQEALVKQLMLYAKSKLDIIEIEKQLTFTQDTLKLCFLKKDGSKEFLREKALYILQKIKPIWSVCLFCGVELVLSVFLGLEEELCVTAQCPECEMNWVVNKDEEKKFIDSLGGEEKVTQRLITLMDEYRDKKSKKEIKVINLNPNFQKQFDGFFDKLLIQIKKKE